MIDYSTIWTTYLHRDHHDLLSFNLLDSTMCSDRRIFIVDLSSQMFFQTTNLLGFFPNFLFVAKVTKEFEKNTKSKDFHLCRRNSPEFLRRIVDLFFHSRSRPIDNAWTSFVCSQNVQAFLSLPRPISQLEPSSTPMLPWSRFEKNWKLLMCLSDRRIEHSFLRENKKWSSSYSLNCFQRSYQWHCRSLSFFLASYNGKYDSDDNINALDRALDGPGLVVPLSNCISDRLLID